MQQLGVSSEQLAGELAALVGHLHRAGQADVFGVAAELDLSISQIRALHVLDCRDAELALHELAAAMEPLSIGAVSRAVDVLARAGLVTRTEDHADRRVKRIAISAGGRAVVGRLAEAKRAGLRSLAESLDDEQRALLSRALEPILAQTGSGPGAARKDAR